MLVLMTSVFFDLRERRIPNWLTLPGALVGLVFSGLGGSAQFLQGILGVVAGIGVLILPFALGWLGAGDVKLFGAVGAFVGLQRIPHVLFYSGLMAGVLAVFVAIIRGVNLQGFLHLWTDLKLLVVSFGRVLPEGISQRTQHEKKTIPWAIAIGLGVVAAVYFDPNGKWAGF